MRETRETALLHGFKVQLHQLIACIFIYSTKWPYVKTMNAKNTKKSQIHENADANITCDFGDGDISRSRSRLTHTRTASSIIVRFPMLLNINFSISLSLGTLSNAFWKSIYITLVTDHSYTCLVISSENVTGLLCKVFLLKLYFRQYPAIHTNYS